MTGRVKDSKADTLNALQNGLIVSVQPIDGGAMDCDEVVVAMARAAIDGGAQGLRIEGVKRVAAVRAALPSAPIVGIVKRDFDEWPIRITALPEDVLALAEAGADIIAIDGTDRSRPHTFADLTSIAHEQGCLVMADLAAEQEADSCLREGADILGSTMSGYTGEAPTPEEPDFPLLAALAKKDCFVIAEGRFSTPELCRAAIEHGADCVTVGSVLTRLEYMTQLFSKSVAATKKDSQP
ncbi:N-acylglucosamine-6-phosphate 2-epimerase [Cohaesibacter sp. ES.047]|uniref:N-acetylmannosamine-6-phosphate 2-epimerase n=1 Tax=Cohaesibacter sp. ES.047 TaxID=1798205 RepID=UPI000BB7233A|nr:putative N-acetylmannosamine-6-phosphate 2-epimerase [Cohaesibacter sp. ES.047]SNY90294.1 N-acylglucosamine-6-phosphate 2-epimerase [Cohaesibacter sp. ES.047]